MASTLVHLPAFVHHTAPRGAIWAAELVMAGWRLLERVGANRARRTLRESASRWEKSDPQRAAILRSAEQHLGDSLAGSKA